MDCHHIFPDLVECCQGNGSVWDFIAMAARHGFFYAPFGDFP